MYLHSCIAMPVCELFFVFYFKNFSTMNTQHFKNYNYNTIRSTLYLLRVSASSRKAFWKISSFWNAFLKFSSLRNVFRKDPETEKKFRVFRNLFKNGSGKNVRKISVRTAVPKKLTFFMYSVGTQLRFLASQKPPKIKKQHARNIQKIFCKSAKYYKTQFGSKYKKVTKCRNNTSFI